MTLDRVAEFLNFVVERHKIWAARQLDLPPPWTADPVLATRKFTNVFRVLDPGSQFVFKLKADNERDTLARLFLYRYTNLPATWEWIADKWGDYPRVATMNDQLAKEWNTLPQVFSGAYMILPAPNIKGNKVEQAINLTRQLFDPDSPDDIMPRWQACTSQAERHKLLMSYYGVGKFLAQQILTDWGYLQDVDRENEFVVDGPGSWKGALLLAPNAKPVDTIYKARETLLSLPNCPQVAGRKPALIDVQNCLCEMSKYVKGPRRNPYTPAHPGPQPEPRLPEWWEKK